MRYTNGLFLPVPGVGSFEKMAAERADNDLFIKLLDRFTAQGRNVSEKKTSTTYAPTAFATDPEGKGKRKGFIDAMTRLFAANKIKVENYGRPSRPCSRLARCNPTEPPTGGNDR